MSLLLEIKCPKCQGVGMVYNSLWAEWYRRRDALLGTEPQPPEPQEPEEIPCIECEGTGKVLTEDGHTVAALFWRLKEEADRTREVRERFLHKARHMP